ncbi:MAG TPA: PAS domain S-box protein [Abditibacteriaceae bacterium]|jgi:diguanylate cyclase (GGDEF)-like protein/PAS domain S-box-containing protein
MTSSNHTAPEAQAEGHVLQEIEKLRADQSRLRAMVEHSYDLVYLIDESGTILSCNPATLRFGYTPEEVVGTNAFDYVHPDDVTKLRAEFYEALQGGQATIGVFRCRCANGEWRWVESVGTNQLDDPAAGAIVINTRDVTERVHAEHAARESEKRFRSMVQNGSDMIGLLSRDGTYLYVSDSVERILGYRPEELVGRSAFEFIHADEATALQKRFGSLLEGNETKFEAFRFRTRSGDWRWVETVLTNLFDDPHVQAMVANSRDITERMRAVEAVEQSENRFRTIVETSREGIWMLNETGHTTYVNERMAEMLGYTIEEMMGHSLFEFMDETAEVEAHTNFERRQQGISEQHDFRFRHKDGHDVWTIIATSPLPTLNGQFTGTLGMITDITERKQAEIALLKSHQFIHSIWESMTDAFVFVDRNWRFIHVNQQAAAILQSSPDNLIGEIVYEVLPEVRDTPFFPAYQKAMTENVPVTVEDLYSPLQRWFEARAYPSEAGLSIYFSDVTDRRVAHEKLLHSAFHDAVTGLPNRALFIERLERSLRRMQRHPEYSFAVLFLDLDRFKIINDSLGHINGDHLLTQVARRLEECVRPEDTVARLGGDEFTILMEGIKDVSDATRLAERVQAALGQPFLLQGHEVFSGASIGIALSDTGYKNGDDVLRDADIAMYRAKHSGRARYEIFDAAMHSRMVTLLQLENDLRRAIERQEFHLHYQPLIALNTGDIIGFEALARWQHAERGLVSPQEFIPVAEESGLILPLGEWVLKQACQQMKTWHDSFPDHSDDASFTICVNVSARQFAQANFVEQVQQALQQTSLNPQRLELEITESLLMENIESAMPKLLQLKELGLQLSLDDFGTGYSSLSYLSQFPIDTLKIDRSFVSRMDVEPDKRAIIGTIINLAHNLKMHVVAEGVETREQMEQLRSLGCDRVQGFLFAQPLQADVAENLIAQQPRW